MLHKLYDSQYHVAATCSEVGPPKVEELDLVYGGNDEGSTRYIGFTLLELLRVVAKPALLVDAVTADRVLSGLLEVEDRTDSLLLELSDNVELLD